MKYRGIRAVSLCFSILFSSNLLALDPHKAITQYVHDVWLIPQGLPHNVTTAIYQTRDGYLWVATQDGIVRFDGVRFTVFNKRNTPEIGNNYADALHEDREGSLWIGTIEGGITRFKDNKFTHFGKEQGLSDKTVDTIFQDRQGTLWVGTDSGLNFWNHGAFSNTFSGKQLPTDRVNSISDDGAGGIWIGTHNKGLFHINDGEITNLSTAHGLSNDRVWATYVDPQGNLWAGTEGGGLEKIKNGKVQHFTTKDGLSSDSVLSLGADSDGNLWIGTLVGINRFHDGKFSSYSVKQGLSQDSVWSIYEDREKNLWIATEYGLNRFRDGKFTIFGTPEGMSNDDARPVMEGPDGSMWVGTREGLNRLKDGKITIYTTRDGLGTNRIASLFVDHEDTLWVGTRGSGGGLSRFDGRRFKSYTTKDGLPDIHVFDIYEDSKQNLWIAPSDSGLTLFKDGKFTTYTMKDGLSNDTVLVVHEDRKGNLWVGTDGGLNLFKDGVFKSFTTRDGLSGNQLREIYEDREGTLWLATADGGLNRFKDGKFMGYTMKSGLSDDLADTVLEDANENLWMSSGKGIFRVSKKELNDFADGKIKSIHSKLYDTADGLRDRECGGGNHPSGWKSRDGKLWIPTAKGVAMIDPANLKTNPLPPPVAIEEVNIDNKRISLSDNVISPGKKDFEFHYTALSLVVPEKVFFKYKLEGYNADWVDAGTRRIAYFTNIAPGQYRFRVKACNNDGVWNESGAAFVFTLQPFFYQTSWFLGLCIFAAGGLIAAAFKIRVRQLKARERQLEAIVQERTTSLLARTEELRVTNEKLQKAQEEIAKLAESSPQALENISAWSQHVASDVARVLNAKEVCVWKVDGESLVPLVQGKTPSPSLADLKGLGSNIVVKDGQVQIPARGMSGETYGVVVLSGDISPQDDIAKRLIAGFANQLGGTLEMLEVRKKLARAEERKMAARLEMKEKGISTLQVCNLCGRCYDELASICEYDQRKLEKSYLLPFKIANRYRLVRLLGEGGMGSVFLAHDENLKRPVSIKVIHSDLLGDPLIKIRLKREADVIARIQHPGVVSIYDFGELPDGSCYILMEFLKGMDLANVVALQGPGAPAQVATVLTQVADALASTHAKGIVHRDLKPANLFLTTSSSGFQVKVLDFGLAKSVTEDVSLTISGMLLGTPAYMSPEQVRGELVDEQTDLFSLAAVAYELLTGKRAFEGENVPDVFTRITREDPPMLSEALPNTSQELDALFLQAFERDAENRPRNINEWAKNTADLLLKTPPSFRGWRLDELLSV